MESAEVGIVEIGIVEIEQAKTRYRNCRQYTVTIPKTRNRNCYTITTTVTSHPDTIFHWLYHMFPIYPTCKEGLLVSLDTRTSYSGTNVAATLQLCICTECLIIKLHHTTAGIPRQFHTFLTYPRNIFAAFENREYYTNKLNNSNHNFEFNIDMPLDLGNILRDPHHETANLSLRDFALRMLDIDLDVCLNNSWRDEDLVVIWESVKLSNDKVRVATTLAFINWGIAFVIGNGSMY